MTIEPVSPYVHYYNRGVNKEAIFFGNDNYIYLISLLEKFIRYYQVELIAFCLMPNHYHLLLKHNSTLQGSRFVQRTFNSYTQAINKQLSRVGTLFQGSVKKRLIDGDDYLSEAVMYIHLNPVKGRLCKHPKDWAYSDYREWAGMKDTSRNVSSECNELFGSIENYIEMIEIELANLPN